MQRPGAAASASPTAGRAARHQRQAARTCKAVSTSSLGFIDPLLACSIFGSAQETVKACPFIGFGLERFCPGALGCQRWSPGPQCFRAEGPCLMAAFRILQTTGNWSVFPIRQPWDACGLGWYAPSEPGNAVRNPGSSKGSGNEPCRWANPTTINGMRGFFPISAACVKCPPPPDRSPSLDLRFRVKRLPGEPLLRRRAQTLKSPPNRAFYRFSLRAKKSLLFFFWAFYPRPVTTNLVRAAAVVNDPILFRLSQRADEAFGSRS